MLNLTKSPEMYLALLVYDGESQSVLSPQVGNLTVQKVSLLDMDNLFDGRSLCIQDHIATAKNGECGPPAFLVVLVKPGAQSTDRGWKCEYGTAAKVQAFGDGNGSNAVGKANTKPNPRKGATQHSVVPFEAGLEHPLEFSDGDFGATPQCDWDESRSAESDSGGCDSDNARELRRYTADDDDDDRKEATKQLSPNISADRYSLYSIARRS